MKQELKEIKQAFKDYYAKNDENATHVFVYSEKQKQRILTFTKDKPKTTINGVEYTEMRNRDLDLTFGFDDVEFIAVGTYNDCKV